MSGSVSAGTRSVVIDRRMATLISTQCSYLCLGDFDPDVPLVLEPCNELGFGDVAMQSGDDAQQGLSLASCAIWYKPSALIFCHDVERPAIAFLEVHQSTHADKGSAVSGGTSVLPVTRQLRREFSGSEPLPDFKGVV